jgi:glycosyltransferase involved in cell wall biosynthesis
MAHIAIFLHGLYSGGVERTVLNLADGLSAHGHSVDLVILKRQGAFKESISEKFRVHDLKASRALFGWKKLAAYLRKERPDVLLSTINYTNIIALFAQKISGVSCRMVVVEHDTFSRWSSQVSASKRLMMRGLIHLTYSWADEIIAVSTGVADDLAQVTRLPREKIRVIYNPVITPDLMVKVSERLDHPWGQADQPPFFLAVGRLTRQKDFENLIYAFSKVRCNLPSRLVILGEGEDWQKLSALASELGVAEDVLLPGFSPNPYSWMRYARAFVLSSQWEGLPTVLIEALYCSPAVISTDCPSGPREILKDGKYGRLVPCSSPDHLAAAMLDAIKEKISQPPAQSWEPYTLNKTVHEYETALLGAR